MISLPGVIYSLAMQTRGVISFRQHPALAQAVLSIDWCECLYASALVKTLPQVPSPENLRLTARWPILPITRPSGTGPLPIISASCRNWLIFSPSTAVFPRPRFTQIADNKAAFGVTSISAYRLFMPVVVVPDALSAGHVVTYVSC